MDLKKLNKIGEIDFIKDSLIGVNAYDMTIQDLYRLYELGELEYKDKYNHMNNISIEKSQEIHKLKLDLIDLRKEVYCNLFQMYECVYLIAEVKGKERKYKGFITKETPMHIKITIWDRKNKDYYSYGVKKSDVIGWKKFNIDEPIKKNLIKILQLKEQKQEELIKVADEFLES